MNFSHWDKYQKKPYNPAWDNALREAWAFHWKFYHKEVNQEIKDREYCALPKSVKNALSYLYEIGEIE